MRVEKILNIKPSLVKQLYLCSTYATGSNFAKTFKADDIRLELSPTKPNIPEDTSKILFGKQFTDHMLTIEWTDKNGWSAPVIGKFRNLEIHPAAKVLHYSLEVFEGMKAYKGVDGKLRLFRPDLNAARFLKSSARSALPSFDKNEFIKCLKKFVSVEKNWIPNSTSASLYLRPTFIGHEGSLGVNVSSKALLFIIASPAGPYFPSGFKPVSLFADPRFVRAFPGGVGNFKMGGNYAPTLNVQMEAVKNGCQQVLWLFGKEHYLTEAGTMNIFVVIKHNKNDYELVTPPLDGTILEGVTRQSVLELARKSGKLKVSERNITMKEIISHAEKDRLSEMFGAGTACVVCPVERVSYKGKNYQIPTMKEGNFMQKFSDELLGIQYGKIKHEWSVVVD